MPYLIGVPKHFSPVFHSTFLYVIRKDNIINQANVVKLDKNSPVMHIKMQLTIEVVVPLGQCNLCDNSRGSRTVQDLCGIAWRLFDLRFGSGVREYLRGCCGALRNVGLHFTQLESFAGRFFVSFSFFHQTQSQYWRCRAIGSKQKLKRCLTDSRNFNHCYDWREIWGRWNPLSILD